MNFLDLKLSKVEGELNLGHYIVLSFIVHVGVIFFQVRDDIDITIEVQQEQQPLQITFVQPNAGTLSGFPIPSDQAETYVPDDTCAWSIEDQQRRLDWEQYAEENGLL